MLFTFTNFTDRIWLYMAKFELRSSNSLIRGIITLLTGGLLVFLPGLTMQTAIIVIGAMMLSSGLVAMLFTHRVRSGTGVQIFSFQGIINIIIGLAFILAPTAMLKFFVTFFGIILLMIGFIQLMGALAVFSWRGWSVAYLLFAFLMLAGGFLLLYNPFESMETILSFIGILLMFYGISQIMSQKVKPRKQFHNGSDIEDVPYEEV